MNKGLRAGTLFMAVVAFAAMAAMQAGAAAGQEMVLQLGHPEAEVEKGIHHFIAMQFRDRIAKYTDGRVEVQIFGNNQLGAERDLLEGMQMGSVDMASTANLIVGNFRAEYKVFDLPYMFKDAQSAYKALDSDYIEELNEKFASEQGIRILSFGSGGFRHVVGNVGEIRKVADLKGVKIRVPENDLYLETFRALGANPTPMAWSEMFTALQQKTVDAFEIVAPVIFTSRFYDVCKNVSKTAHFFSPDPFMISESVWASLSPEDQAAFKKAAHESAIEQRKMVEAYEKEVFQELEEKGMTVNDVDDVEEFKKATADVINKFRSDIGAEVIDAVSELAK